MLIQITKTPGVLIGAQWHAAGSIVDIPEDRARMFVRIDHAVPFVAQPAEEYAVAEPVGEIAVSRERKRKR